MYHGHHFIYYLSFTICYIDSYWLAFLSGFSVCAVLHGDKEKTLGWLFLCSRGDSAWLVWAEESGRQELGLRKFLNYVMDSWLVSHDSRMHVCLCFNQYMCEVYQVCLTLMPCLQFLKFSHPISTLKFETRWEKVWLLKWKDKGQDSTRCLIFMN